MTESKEKAQQKIAAWWRSIQFKRTNKITVKSIGPGIIITSIKAKKFSTIFGPDYQFMDRTAQPHEVIITTIDPTKVTLSIVTNQGTPDHLRKYMASYNINYSAVINGGFYACDDFYKTGNNQPIGLAKFAANYIPLGRIFKNPFKKSVNNLDKYGQYDKTAVTDEKKSYPSTIETRLNKNTQLPQVYQNDYALIAIQPDNKVEVTPYRKLNQTKVDEIKSESNYAFSAGPILVENNEVCFSKTQLNDPKYQFETIKKAGKTHPGELPPGTFYHADQANPRSAFAIMGNGSIKWVTVKGNEDHSRRDGLDLHQFAKLLKALHVNMGINLDGGHSTFQGGFNKDTMLTPHFMNQSGTRTTVPYSLLASSKQVESCANQMPDAAMPSQTRHIPVAERITFTLGKRKQEDCPKNEGARKQKISRNYNHDTPASESIPEPDSSTKGPAKQSRSKLRKRLF